MQQPCPNRTRLTVDAQFRLRCQQKAGYRHRVEVQREEVRQHLVQATDLLQCGRPAAGGVDEFELRGGIHPRAAVVDRPERAGEAPLTYAGIVDAQPLCDVRRRVGRAV